MAFIFLLVQKIEAFITEDKDKCCLIQLPTGAGKTRTTVEALIQFCNSSSQNNEYCGLLWLAHTEELCEQAIDSFKRLWQVKGEYENTFARLWGDYKINIKEVRSEVEMHFRLIHMQNNGKTCKYSKMISLKPESETKMNYDLNEPVASKCFLNFIGGISGLKWKDDASELDPENWESFAIDEFTNIWVNHSKWLKLCFHKGKLFCYEKIFKVYPITPGPDRPSLTILADAERELKNSQKPSEILFNGNEAIFWSSSGVDTALIYYPISPIEKNDFVGIRYNHVVSAVYLPVYNKFKSGEFVRSGNVVDRVLGKYIPERTN